MRLTRNRDPQGRLIRTIGVGMFGATGRGGSILGVTGSGVTPVTVQTATPHGLSTGQTVLIAGTGTDADGTWTISDEGSDLFTLNGSDSVVASAAGVGTWTLVS